MSYNMGIRMNSQVLISLQKSTGNAASQWPHCDTSWALRWQAHLLLGPPNTGKQCIKEENLKEENLKHGEFKRASYTP